MKHNIKLNITALAAVACVVTPLAGVLSVYAEGEAGLDAGSESSSEVVWDVNSTTVPLPNVKTLSPMNLLTQTEGVKLVSDEDDAENGIHYITAHLDFSENDLPNILAQTPGAGSHLSSFYAGIQLTNYIAANTFEKSGGYASKSATIEEQKAAALVQLSSGYDSKNTFWPVMAVVEYWDSANSAWATSETGGDSKTSIGADLASHVGKSVSELVYGVDYRIRMRDDQYGVNVWRDKVAGTDEYVFVNYEANFFPVIADDGNGMKFLYTADTLDDALNDATIKNVTVTGDITVSSEVKIPEGKTLEVAADKTITLEGSGVIVEDGGTFKGAEGSVMKGGKSQVNTLSYIIALDGGLKDMVTLSVLAGATVKLDIPTEYEGSLLSYREVVANGNTVNVEDGTIVMPAEGVRVYIAYAKPTSSMDLEEEVKEPVAGVLDAEKFEEQIVNDAKVKALFGEGESIRVISEAYTIEGDAIEATVNSIFNSEEGKKVREKYDSIVNQEGVKTFGLFDINIWATNGVKSENVSELSEKVEFVIQLPSDMEEVAEGKVRNYYVVRTHWNADDSISVDRIDAKLSEDGKYISFASDKFSYFTGIYEDVDDIDAGNYGAFTAENGGAAAMALGTAVMVGIITAVVSFVKLNKKAEEQE